MKWVLRHITNNEVEMNTKMFDKEYPISITNSDENADQNDTESNKLKVEDYEVDKTLIEIANYK